MRNFLNISLFSLKTGRFSIRFSVPVLAFCLAFCSRVASSDIVTETVPTGPFSGDYVLTNITFSTPEQITWFRRNVLDEAEDVLDRTYTIRGWLNLTLAGCSNIYLRCGNVYNALTDEYDHVIRPVRDQLNAITHIVEPGHTGGTLYLDNIPYQVFQIQRNLDIIDDDVSYMTNIVEDVVLYNANFATAAFAENSSGEVAGCTCPDYTTILNQLSTSLSSIVATITSINGTLTGMSSALDRIDPNVYSILSYQQEIYYTLGGMATNLVSCAGSLSTIYSVLNDDISSLLASIYAHLDLFRADFELYAGAMTNKFLPALVGVTNQLLSAYIVESLNRWFGTGEATFTYSPIRDFRYFFGNSRSYPWGTHEYSSFREFLEYQYMHPILYALGYLTREDAQDYVDYPESNWQFVDSVHAIASNVYEVAGPDRLGTRGRIYQLWAQSTNIVDMVPGMPTGDEVAEVPYYDAIIGLLYRIQFLLSVPMATRADTNGIVIYEEIPPPARDAYNQLMSSEFISPSTTNFPFLRIWASIRDSLNSWHDNIADIQIADHWLVLDDTGFTMQFQGSTGDPLITGSQAPIYIPQSFSESQSSFWYGVKTFMGLIWYCLGALLALALTYFVFRFVWGAVSFSISVIGGDFNSAVQLFHKLGITLTGVES